MKALVSLVAAAACLTAAPAMAQVYGSVGYTNMDVSGANANLGAINGRIGAHVNKYLGGELEVLGGVRSETITVDNVDVKIKLNDEFGIYGVGFWPVNDNFELLGRVGYGTYHAKFSAPDFAASEDGKGSGVLYGVGAQYFFTKHNGVRADYTRDEAAGSNNWSIAYAFRF